MPSIQDVADQINGKLDTLITNTAATVTVGSEIRDQVATLNGRVAAVDARLQQGFGELAGGLFAIWEVQKVALAHLAHQSSQNDTVICLLANGNDLLCGITRKLTQQLEVSHSAHASIERMEGILERVYAEAAGDVDRMAVLEARVRECCPPPEPRPEPCPDPCPVPRLDAPRPRGQDWSPSPPRPTPQG